MSVIDRQAAFSGTKDVGGRARDRCRAARSVSRIAPARLQRARCACGNSRAGNRIPTYLLETPARRYVLRRKPPGKLLPSAHAVDREFRVISALHAQGFPVAAPVLYCADDDIVGTPFYVMGHVEGRVIWEPHMPDAPRCRARGGLRRHECDAGAAAFVRSGRARACRLRPRRELRRRARSSAGRSSTAPPRPTPSRRWNG